MVCLGKELSLDLMPAPWSVRRLPSTKRFIIRILHAQKRGLDSEQPKGILTVSCNEIMCYNNRKGNIKVQSTQHFYPL